MDSGPRSQRAGSRHRRVGLVLGAGGILGAAWIAGALPAVEGLFGGPLADTDLVVGTSAGSVLAAALRCGVPVDTVVSHHQAASAVLAGGFDRDSGPLPPIPRLGLGSPRLLMSAARTPGRIGAWVAASALLPPGRAHHDSLAVLLESITSRADGRLLAGDPPWPRDPTWIMCIDYNSGSRVAFGRHDSPAASLSEAVVASCSVPGWHEPKVIDGRRYVDGGVASTTSLGLIADTDLDEVYVLAPMASYRTDRPRSPGARAERLLRRLYTAQLTHEAATARAAGIKVSTLTPGPEDLAAMGSNLMDSARRKQVLEVSQHTTPRQLAALAAARGTASVGWHTPRREGETGDEG
jgi:NTE family protein